MTFTFKTPSLIILSGSSQAGKTTFVHKLLANRHLFESRPRKVLYCMGVETTSHPPAGVDLYKGLPDEDSIKVFCGGAPAIVVLDDLLIEMQKRPEMLRALAIRLVHHLNITVIILTQSLFDVSRVVRTNANYVVLFRSDASQLAVAMYGRQLFTGATYKYFMESFKDATAEPYSYLVVDIHPRTHPDIRLLSDIFSPFPTIYVPKK